MKSFKYIGDAPFMPLKIQGKLESIKELALVDTGAKYVSIRSDLGDLLSLPILRREKLSGFGSQDKFEIGISKALVEVNGIELAVEVAIVEEQRYPDKAPIAIIGRNFLNRCFITLDGEEICIERSRVLEHI